MKKLFVIAFALIIGQFGARAQTWEVELDNQTSHYFVAGLISVGGGYSCGSLPIPVALPFWGFDAPPNYNWTDSGNPADLKDFQGNVTGFAEVIGINFVRYPTNRPKLTFDFCNGTGVVQNSGTKTYNVNGNFLYIDWYFFNGPSIVSPSSATKLKLVFRT